MFSIIDNYDQVIGYCIGNVFYPESFNNELEAKLKIALLQLKYPEVQFNYTPTRLISTKRPSQYQETTYKHSW